MRKSFLFLMLAAMVAFVLACTPKEQPKPDSSKDATETPSQEPSANPSDEPSVNPTESEDPSVEPEDPSVEPEDPSVEPEDPSVEPEAITIDGEFEDWADIEGTVREETNITASNAIAEVKACADASKIYVYVKRAKIGRWGDVFKGDSKEGYYYFDFDLDNDPETGSNVENSHGNYEAYCYLYIFGGSADEPVFRETPPGTASGMTITNVKCNGAVGEEFVEVEAAFPIADLPEITSNTISVSVWGNKDANPLTKVTFDR